MKRINIIRIAVAACLVAAATVLFTYNPEAVNFYPRCPSKWLTGHDCPGCGSLRGMHALLHGEIARAWHYNAALFFALPAIAFFAFAHRYKPGSAAHRLAYSRYTPWLVLVSVVAWWLLR